MTLKFYYGILSLNQEKRVKIGGKYMLNDKICKKREELNKSIEENKSYDEIYKISVELDQLIAEYYKIKE